MSTHNIPFLNIKKGNHLNYPKSAGMRLFSSGPYNEFESAVVNEPSVFEPLKFYYTFKNGTLFSNVFVCNIVNVSSTEDSREMVLGHFYCVGPTVGPTQRKLLNRYALALLLSKSAKLSK